jgi:hypothetical protein
MLCLISTAKALERSEELSEQDQRRSFMQAEQKLLESALSVCLMKSADSKVKLFRSDSLDKKSYEEPPPIEVEIHQKNLDDSGISEIKDFKFDLFNSLGMNLPMTLSVEHN